MPGVSSPACSRCGTCRFSVRVHVDVADAMFVAQSGRLEHDDELAFAGVRGLHVDAEDSRAGRCIDAKDFRLAGAALQADLDVAFGERLEGVEPRQVNREPRRRADRERRILGEQLRLVGPPRHTQRFWLLWCRGRSGGSTAARRRGRRSRASSTDVSRPQCVSHCAFQGDLCQARIKPQDR